MFSLLLCLQVKALEVGEEDRDYILWKLGKTKYPDSPAITSLIRKLFVLKVQFLHTIGEEKEVWIISDLLVKMLLESTSLPFFLLTFLPYNGPFSIHQPSALLLPSLQVSITCWPGTTVYGPNQEKKVEESLPSCVIKKTENFIANSQLEYQFSVRLRSTSSNTTTKSASNASSTFTRLLLNLCFLGEVFLWQPY